MWLVRIITLVLIILPFVVPGGHPLILTLLFFPAIASAIAVAHQASDHEDEEDTDFVSPVFWQAARESGWVFIALTVITSLSPHMGLEDGFLGSLLILAPSAVYVLAGCHIGVLFIKEHMSREVEAFGAGAITTAYLVVCTSGLYYLLLSPYADMVWPMPVAVIMVAGLARIVARFIVGPVKIGTTWSISAVTVIIAGWTVLAFPLIHSMIQQKVSSQLLACEVNLENVGAALEMYSSDWSGQYPDQADMAGHLVPNYLKSMPICPTSKHGYAFEVGPDAPSNESRHEDYYFVFCQGNNHPDSPPDYPRYSIIEGLTVR
jgi:hypothetical protein